MVQETKRLGNRLIEGGNVTQLSQIQAFPVHKAMDIRTPNNKKLAPGRFRLYVPFIPAW